MADIATDILDTIKKVIDHDCSFTALDIPVFEGNEKHYLAECVDSNFVSSIGEFVDRFEGMLAAFTGVRKAVLCVNGTAALHSCLNMSGFSPNRHSQRAITGSIPSSSSGNMQSKGMRF